MELISHLMTNTGGGGGGFLPFFSTRLKTGKGQKKL